jgi:hypothetical protein
MSPGELSAQMNAMAEKKGNVDLAS